MRPAAIALVMDGWARLLAVSRINPPYEMAIPGGEVDPGETPEQAALRELWEEANVTGHDARLVWIGRSPTDGRPVFVYLVGRWTGVPYAREGGVAAWMTPEHLVAQGKRFGSFYVQMLQATAA
jgi:8-oxo-dGTP pyrophosphatase MutT (NUDIX family)